MVRAAARHQQAANASEAQRGQDRAATTSASACPRTGTLACQRHPRALQLLRRARQQRRDQRVPRPGDPALVLGAQTPQPAPPPELGTHAPHRQTMATASPRDASQPCRTLRRQNPREEPSAVVPLAGICAGGGQQWPSLPRSQPSCHPTGTIHLSRGGCAHRVTHRRYLVHPTVATTARIHRWATATDGQSAQTEAVAAGAKSRCPSDNKRISGTQAQIG